jgi:hypothetical protein
MKAILKGLHSDLVHCISIIIGTVPLVQSTCPQETLPPPSAPPAAGTPVAAYTDMRTVNLSAIFLSRHCC